MYNTINNLYFTKFLAEALMHGHITLNHYHNFNVDFVCLFKQIICYNKSNYAYCIRINIISIYMFLLLKGARLLRLP